MIWRKAGRDVSEATVHKHFKQGNVAFFKFREKPFLEKGDSEEAEIQTLIATVEPPDEGIIEVKDAKLPKKKRGKCRKAREFKPPPDCPAINTAIQARFRELDPVSLPPKKRARE